MILRLNTITDPNQLFREFVKDGKPVAIEPDAIEGQYVAFVLYNFTKNRFAFSCM